MGNLRYFYTCCIESLRVGIDLKELGRAVSCRSVLNFAQQLNFKAVFHSKMGICIHQLKVQPPPPPTIPTLKSLVLYLVNFLSLSKELLYAYTAYRCRPILFRIVCLLLWFLTF